ncbi:MAG: hypothetical protein KGJ94_10935 [Xanthomonadaceae bacterium]|nr:hypothetical protein [Xanthomonadaceae bacterium]
MFTTINFLCARCQVPLEGPVEPNPKDRLNCPRCWEGDAYEAVVAEVKDYIREKKARQLTETIDTSGQAESDGSINASDTLPGRHWRFIADVGL